MNANVKKALFIGAIALVAIWASNKFTPVAKIVGKA